MEVYVIRHTAVAVENGICYGQLEVPLAESFEQEAEKLKSELPTSFEAVYCSPLQRCKVLAEKLGLANIFYEKALMEMNFGEWEGKFWNEINPQDLAKWMTDFVHIPAPKGENLSLLYARLRDFMDNLRQKTYKNVLLITHAGVIRALWAYLLEIPLQHVFKIPVSYGEILGFHLGTSPQNDWIFRLK